VSGVEKVWFRSQATVQDSKKPERAKIIAGQFNHDQKDNKHAYVLLSDKADMDKALELNQEVFEGKHLRVDRAFGSKELDRKSENDFNTTIFVGNLPFVVGEEEVRQHFEPCGTITNVRLIREPKTFIGKGIGYVMFENKEAMRKAVDTKHDSSFKGRKIRVKKAVEPKRLEKK
jgi:nucleolar protein 12